MSQSTAGTYASFIAKLEVLPNGEDVFDFALHTITEDVTPPELPEMLVLLLFALSTVFFGIIVIGGLSLAVILWFRGLWLARLRRGFIITNTRAIFAATVVLSAAAALMSCVDQIVIYYRLFGFESSMFVVLFTETRWFFVMMTTCGYAHSVMVHMLLSRQETQTAPSGGLNLSRRCLNASLVLVPVIVLSVQTPLIVLASTSLNEAIRLRQSFADTLTELPAQGRRSSKAGLDPYLGDIERIYSALQSASTFRRASYIAWAATGFSLLVAFIPFFIPHIQLLASLARPRRSSVALGQLGPEIVIANRRLSGTTLSDVKAPSPLAPPTPKGPPDTHRPVFPIAILPSAPEPAQPRLRWENGIGGIHDDCRILILAISGGFVSATAYCSLATWVASRPLFDETAWRACAAYDLVAIAAFLTGCLILIVVWPAWKLLTGRGGVESDCE